MYCLLCNRGNYSRVKRKKDNVKFLVIHYTGNNGDTARDNLRYFYNNDVNASAHFFVDEKEVCCSVPWYFTAWHCGTKGSYKHDECRNANSIGIELCSRKDGKGNYYFHPKTVERAAKFIALQMKVYGILIENVVRHYDVTGKRCPAPYVDEKCWASFKNKILEYYDPNKEDENMVYYEKLSEIPAGEQREVVEKLVKRGTIKGDENGLHLSSDMCRTLVYMAREGVIK